jgi:hypothetical protein
MAPQLRGNLFFHDRQSHSQILWLGKTDSDKTRRTAFVAGLPEPFVVKGPVRHPLVV